MDFYGILGVDRRASMGEVKRAYTRLARRYHPDINPGDREAAAFYRRATQAYETLSEPGSRESYDAYGQSVPRTKSTTTVEFRGFDFSAPVPGVSATFTELFSEVLHDSGGQAATEAKIGSDLFAEVPLSFEEALRGTERRLAVTRLEMCSICSGTGARRAAESVCPRCQGTGTTRWRRGHMVFSKSCTQCGGKGRQRQRPCASCAAEGMVSRTNQITVQVPAGVANGTRMRVAKKGNMGRRGGAAGDLYITAVVGDHPFFVRDGKNLHVEVPITVSEAVLGAQFEVPTVDGRVQLRIPPSTPSGQQFFIKEQGASSPRTGERGDLIITVALALPCVEDERSKELLREFGRINTTNVRSKLFAE